MRDMTITITDGASTVIFETSAHEIAKDCFCTAAELEPRDIADYIQQELNGDFYKAN